MTQRVETGHLQNLTANETAVLQEFNQKLEQWRSSNPDLAQTENRFRDGRRKLGEDDNVLSLKFLRARNFNCDVSLKLLTDSIEWRKNFQGMGVESIDVNTIQKELNSGKALLQGKDNEGRPILWVRSYLHKKKESDPVELQRMAVYVVEDMAAHLVPPIETATVVCDMNNLRMENIDLSFLKFIAEIVTSRYPECLGLCLLVDAPWLFNATWKVISPWLDVKTKEKIHFVKRNEVQNWIPHQNLLPEFGGNQSLPLSH